ncbi:MAG: hypothetical protein SO141_02940 [Alphaproteobacteria bacterium]|nr:hypothetical protein [Alphaproteobacteria bacterium]
MADEKLDVSEEALTQEAGKLFALLNKEELMESDKMDIDGIVQKNPLLLSWKGFAEKVALPDLMTAYMNNESIDTMLEDSSKSIQTAKRVLDNLQKVKADGWLRDVENPTAEVAAGIAPNGETIGTQLIKNISFLQSLQKEPNVSAEQRAMVKQHYNDECRGFVDKMYDENGYGADKNQPNLQNQTPKDLIKDIVGDRQTLVVENKQEAPLKTLSIEELNDKAYQGTLTVEQANERRKRLDEKKIADMVSQPGDSKKQKHESNDKFKDEDVIKYMYEDWILGGASWLFNKAEDAFLNIVDSAVEICIARAGKRKAEKQTAANERLSAASAKANAFAKMAAKSQTDLGADCAANSASYDAILNDLSNNLNNPDPHWEYFDKDDEFVKKLQANPSKSAEFIEYASEELKNRTQFIESTGKLAMMMTAARMTEEFMGDDGKWRNNGEYLSDKELQVIFAQKTRECQKDIFKAVSIISEDMRLLSEAAYDKLQGQKPDLATFTAENTDREVNAFLKQLAGTVKTAVEIQQKDLDEKAFDNFSAKKHDRSVARSIRNADKLIAQKIQNGAVYENSLFEKEHSKERIEAKTGLFEEAMKENSPAGLAKTFEYMKQLNQYQAQTNDARLRGVESRKQAVQKFKDKIVKRDPAVFNRIAQNNSGKGM